MKNLYFVLLSILVIIYIMYSVRKNKLSVKNSFVWVLICIVMLFLAIFPYSLDWLSKLIGVEYPPALFLTLCVILLMVQNFNYSKKITSQQEKIIELEQQLSLLKDKVNNYGKK